MQLPYELAQIQGEDGVSVRVVLNSETTRDGALTGFKGSLILDGVISGEFPVLIAMADLPEWRSVLTELQEGRPAAWRKDARAMALIFELGDWDDFWLKVEHPTYPYIDIRLGFSVDEAWFVDMRRRVDGLIG